MPTATPRLSPAFFQTLVRIPPSTVPLVDYGESYRLKAKDNYRGGKARRQGWGQEEVPVGSRILHCRVPLKPKQTHLTNCPLSLRSYISATSACFLHNRQLVRSFRSASDPKQMRRSGELTARGPSVTAGGESDPMVRLPLNLGSYSPEPGPRLDKAIR